MRLWNARREVSFRKKSLLPFPVQRLREAKPDGWRDTLSGNVVKYVDDLKKKKLSGTSSESWARIQKIRRNPAEFFSRPKNVPPQMRNQIYLPNFVVSLIRTPDSPPKYASFWVPLWFNKLDFRNYLKNGYDVDVVHVRSYVQQQKVQRKRFEKKGRVMQGALYRPTPRKRMTVELLDPFVYPTEEKDMTPWESESYKSELLEGYQEANEGSGQPTKKTKQQIRDSMAEQAKQLLEGKRKWRPSWQSIAADARPLQNTTRPPGIRGIL